jgi:hypothetical protein
MAKVVSSSVDQAVAPKAGSSKQHSSAGSSQRRESALARNHVTLVTVATGSKALQQQQ